MKKLLLLSTLIFTVYCGFGQSPKTQTDPAAESMLRLGLHFTPTVGFAKSDKSNISGAGATLGYNFGLTGDIKFADHYYFCTGIDVVTSPIKINYKDTLRDTSSTSSFSLPDVNMKYRLQYLGIPLVLKLKTDQMEKMKYYGQFGVEPQFNINKKVNANKGRYGGSSFNIPSETAYASFNDDISFVRLGLVIGGGLEYALGGTTAFTAGLSYNAGFTDLSKDAKAKITNGYIAINFGVLF